MKKSGGVDSGVVGWVEDVLSVEAKKENRATVVQAAAAKTATPASQQMKIKQEFRCRIIHFCCCVCV